MPESLKIKANNNSDPDYTFAVLGKLNKTCVRKKGKVINLLSSFLFILLPQLLFDRAFVKMKRPKFGIFPKLLMFCKLNKIKVK